jgi:hypothetical protein
LEDLVNDLAEEGTRGSIMLAEKLFADIKDVRDELNILKSSARFQKKVQRDLARDYVYDTNHSADYVENDITEMDSVADRIQSAVSLAFNSNKYQFANYFLTKAERDSVAPTKRDCE